MQLLGFFTLMFGGGSLLFFPCYAEYKRIMFARRDKGSHQTQKEKGWLMQYKFSLCQ